MNIQIGKKAVDFIFAEETGGKEFYDIHGAKPSWPKGSSGITVGAGYDLGYNTPEEIERSWKGIVNDNMIQVMKSVSGLRGQKAANALTSKVINSVYVPYDVAFKQFMNKVIVGEVALTIKTFPKSEELNPDTIGVLTSIVYNRGSAMNDHDPKEQDRKEMRLIKMLVPQKDYKGIAAQIDSMKRLWDGVPNYAGDHEQKFTGLVIRRQKEANLVLNSQREYLPEELLTLSIPN